MNRRELITAIADDLGTDRRAAEAFITSFVDVVMNRVAKGEPVLISGFAKFARVDRAARMGRNPQTGEPIKIAASRKVRITPLKAFKDSVLRARKRR
jgi:DNA-binding protein HU-beta